MEGMYTFPPDGERKEEGHIYSRKSVCFYEKQTPLQYLHPLVILVLSNFCPVCKKTVCVGGQSVVKGFRWNVSCLGGNKIRAFCCSELQNKSLTLDGRMTTQEPSPSQAGSLPRSDPANRSQSRRLPSADKSRGEEKYRITRGSEI